MTASAGPLAGTRVLVTRERPGELGEMLEARGAVVVHAPLIAVRDPDDGGLALRSELERLSTFDWLVVTSVEGAERVGAAARDAPAVRLAAVGTATARTLARLAGRAVDLVPSVQTGAALAAALDDRVDHRIRVLVVQADRAAPTLVDLLVGSGHDVTACVGYRTVLLDVDPEVIAGADALVLASGSSAESWVASVGLVTPPVVVAIGPTTAGVARRLGLKISSVSADHSLAGLVTELERQLAGTSGAQAGRRPTPDSR
ncbi:MAG: uroporphyrinogen-III synthase [Ilumatobacteraceae bacterium]